jgi:death-on-curing protein
VEPKWIPLELVLLIHDLQLTEHGGRQGIRDLNALKSAIARLQNLLSYGKKPTLFDLAASVAAGIAKNHPFIDGNKRTALVVAMSFLELNGFDSTATEEAIAIAFEQLAAGTLNDSQLARWFKQHAIPIRKRPRTAE